MNALTQFLLKAGPARIFAALGVTGLVAAGLFALMFRIGGEEKALLFADVPMSEAADITSRLDQANIAYELRGDGSSIFVPRSRVLEARMMLSAEGLPTSGSVGYEIFDRQDALSATQFQQNINRLRALEGELARTIVSLDGVKSARVHLVLPERQLFERDRQEPSASIVLDAADLSPAQVRAVRNLVASAAPGLKPERVTVLDGAGKLLAAGDGEASGFGAEGVDSRQAAVEERIRRTVQDIVASVVGPTGARVQVTAEMDFNRITQNSETFDPEGRVAKSTSTIEETNNEQSREPAEGATAGRNVPDGTQAGGGEAGSQAAGSRTEERIDYALSRTTKTEIIEGGRMRRLSVAVAVDGVTTPGADGQPPQWAPRDQAELDRIAALVRSAVGFDEARGDRVEVVNVRFAAVPVEGTEAVDPGPFDLRQADIMRIAEIVAVLLVGLALVFFVLRPLIMGLIRPAAAPGAAGALAGPSGAGEGGQLTGPAGQAALPSPEREDAMMVDIARIQGQVNASTVKKVAEVVDQHPEESVAIIRGWLQNAM